MRAPKAGHPSPPTSPRLDRRRFLGWASYRGVGLGLAGASLPALLAACGTDDEPVAGGGTTAGTAEGGATALVGDVLDFELSSDEWEGAFGSVSMRIHRGVVEGSDVYYVRTDVSDQAVAEEEALVWVPKLAPLATPELAGVAYLVSGGPPEQGTVLSTEPGRDDYTPAWRIHRATWTGAPRLLSSAAEVGAAQRQGELSVEVTDVVLNAPVVRWSTGELAVDTELRGYFGTGPLVEAPDTSAMTVRFKLHECFPRSRYIVTEHSIAPAAEMTITALAPKLDQGPTDAGATGRTNVFMNGVPGSGPMGFQPSAFDFPAGDPAWSPYWDHYTYAWNDGVTPRVLTSEIDVHAARDAGELTEFPGLPDTDGRVFTVNCPVPVLAPNSV